MTKEKTAKKKKYMDFKTFVEMAKTEEGLLKIDALVAQKVLGKKVKIGDSGKYLRVEAKSEAYPKGGSYAIKKYTSNSAAIEELINDITAGEVLIIRYYRNAMIDGKESVDARFEVILKYRGEDGKEKQVSQKGSKFSMNIITVAALLRWKGVLQEK